MKNCPASPLLVGLTLSAGFALSVTAAVRMPENVCVFFQDPDNFTDVCEAPGNLPSTAYLDELHDYVQKTAAPLLPAKSKLTVTFIDVDLAGMIRPDKNNLRVMTGTTLPRAHVKFQLRGENGRIIKEGERSLSDLNYQQSAGVQNRNDPLGYDKQLLKDWLHREFKNVS